MSKRNFLLNLAIKNSLGPFFNGTEKISEESTGLDTVLKLSYLSSMSAALEAAIRDGYTIDEFIHSAVEAHNELVDINLLEEKQGAE